MSSHLTRRDFLKLSQIALPLFFSPLIQYLPADLDTGPDRQDHQQRQTSGRPNILILVFDSLSAQHMPLYGYPRPTTPNLQQFAERSAVYHAHYAAGNFTTPATASILTGVYPWTHRSFNLGALGPVEFVEKNIFSAFAGQGYHSLAYSHNRLADFLLNRFRTQINTYIPRSTFLLQDRQILPRFFLGDKRIASMGEELVFIRHNQSSLFLSLLDRMFDPGQRTIHEDFPRGLPEAFRATFLLENAVDGIAAAVRSAPQPFLGYFHLLPPHEPYRTRVDFKDQFEDGWSPAPKPVHFFSQNEPDDRLDQLRRGYDEYLAYVDAEFGRLVGLMEQSGLLQNTVIVFTSDHGQLFERGIHGHITPVLFDPVVHVPLLIYDPSRPFRQDIYTPTSCIDLLPTLLAIAGGQKPEWAEGVVMPPYAPEDPDPERSIYILEAKQNARLRPLTRATAAVVKGRSKLVTYLGYPGFDGQAELYDLDQDQEERVNLVSVRKNWAGEIRSELEQKLRAVNSPYANRS